MLSSASSSFHTTAVSKVHSKNNTYPESVFVFYIFYLFSILQPHSCFSPAGTFARSKLVLEWLPTYILCASMYKTMTDRRWWKKTMFLACSYVFKFFSKFKTETVRTCFLVFSQCRVYESSRCTHVVLFLAVAV